MPDPLYNPNFYSSIMDSVRSNFLGRTLLGAHDKLGNLRENRDQRRKAREAEDELQGKKKTKKNLKR